MAQRRTNRFNVVLDEEHAARLHRLAERTYVNPGTLARSLLSTALDQVEPDGVAISTLLDSIPGAIERAERGREDVRAGRVVSLDDL